MAAQVVTVEELIGYLTEIADESGDIPVVTRNAASGEIESVGRPLVLPLIPTKEVDGFQAYSFTPQGDASNLKAAIIY